MPAEPNEIKTELSSEIRNEVQDEVKTGDPSSGAPKAYQDPSPVCDHWQQMMQAVLGFVMLVISFVMLLTINLLQAWGRRRHVQSAR